MSKAPLRLGLLVTLALFIVAPGFIQAEERSLLRSFPVRDGQEIQIKLGSAGLLVQGSDGDEVEVTMILGCANDGECKGTDQVELVSVSRSDQLSLRVEGAKRAVLGDLQVKVRALVPRHLALELDVAAGDVRVVDHRGSLEIDVGAGDVEVETAAEVVRELEMDAGVGNATLEISGQQIRGSGFIGSALQWSQDRGSSRIEVDCGVGDIVVRLL